jgi:hypothetical protein
VYWKGIGVFGEDKGFHSTPSTHPSPSLRATLRIWYNLHSYFIYQRGESSQQRAYISLKYPFLAIHAKGGESISPKQKDRTTTLILKEFFKFIEGEFCLSQRKSIWNRGRKFQILKMLLKILFIHLWLFAKELWKEFTKEFAKTKQVVQAWSKMLKIKKQSMRILWVFILAQF